MKIISSVFLFILLLACIMGASFLFSHEETWWGVGGGICCIFTGVIFLCGFCCVVFDDAINSADEEPKQNKQDKPPEVKS